MPLSGVWFRGKQFVKPKKMYAEMAGSYPSRMRDQIDENLKRIYNKTLNEEIPDRLTGLLDQLRRSTSVDTGDDGQGKF